jgi:hypothetical protein
MRDHGVNKILTVIGALLACLIWVPKDQIVEVAVLGGRFRHPVNSKRGRVEYHGRLQTRGIH